MDSRRRWPQLYPLITAFSPARDEGGLLRHLVTISLTDVRPTDNIKARINLAHVKDVSRVTAAGGASAVPADGGSSLLFPGGSGISLPAL
jgi:hypothetical protein